MMLELAKAEDFEAKHLVPAANFNVGRAYFLGDGIAKNVKLAEKLEKSYLFIMYFKLYNFITKII